MYVGSLATSADDRVQSHGHATTSAPAPSPIAPQSLNDTLQNMMLGKRASATGSSGKQQMPCLSVPHSMLACAPKLVDPKSKTLNPSGKRQMPCLSGLHNTPACILKYVALVLKVPFIYLLQSHWSSDCIDLYLTCNHPSLICE